MKHETRVTQTQYEIFGAPGRLTPMDALECSCGFSAATQSMEGQANQEVEKKRRAHLLSTTSNQGIARMAKRMLEWRDLWEDSEHQAWLKDAWFTYGDSRPALKPETVEKRKLTLTTSRVCAYGDCDKEFIPTTPKQIYCGKTHKQYAYLQRKAEAAKRLVGVE